MGKETKKGSLIFSEEEIYGVTEIVEDKRQFVVFRLGDEWYGIDVDDVREVVPSSSYAPLPNVPEHILGLFSLRGEIVSLTNISRIFGIEADEIKEDSLVVVIANDEMTTGLLVDGCEEIADIPVSKIEEAVSTLRGRENSAITGQLEWKNRLVAILDSQKIISLTKLNQVNLGR